MKTPPLEYKSGKKSPTKDRIVDFLKKKNSEVFRIQVCIRDDLVLSDYLNEIDILKVIKCFVLQKMATLSNRN